MNLTILIFTLIFSSALGLENGLVRTPPMGWLHWERFRCTTDCKTYPKDCISEKLFMDMADKMASEGYKEAGYEYVIMDDCWLAPQRSSEGILQPDPQRFPNGIRALADYIHGKDLKFGLYEDVGAKTCAGYPGSEFYFQLDAQTFADWHVDYLKFDGCNYAPQQYQFGYPPMAFFLNMTGRPIVLSCEYALYQKPNKPDYKAQATACNLARNFDDIDDSWVSVKSVIDYYAANTYNFAEVAEPGYFNDPDMLVIGNFGLSLDQEKVQMAMWCILAAPLIMSNDLRSIRAESKALLLNKSAIAINQDPLGLQGKLVNKIGNVQVWSKPIMPNNSYAFALVNMNTAMPTKVTLAVSTISSSDTTHPSVQSDGRKKASGFNVTEVFDGTFIGSFKPTDSFTVSVNPTGVFFGRATAF